MFTNDNARCLSAVCGRRVYLLEIKQCNSSPNTVLHRLILLRPQSINVGGSRVRFTEQFEFTSKSHKYTLQQGYLVLDGYLRRVLLANAE